MIAPKRFIKRRLMRRKTRKAVDQKLKNAVYANRPEEIREALEAGAAPNKKDRLETRPIHIATEKGNVEAAEILIDHGARTRGAFEGINGEPVDHINKKHEDFLDLFERKGKKKEKAQLEKRIKRQKRAFEKEIGRKPKDMNELEHFLSGEMRRVKRRIEEERRLREGTTSEL
jgi:ankyrin repeat protein